MEKVLFTIISITSELFLLSSMGLTEKRLKSEAGVTRSSFSSPVAVNKTRLYSTITKSKAMASHNASVYIDFHNQANQSFFSLEKDFLAAAEKVNRNEEEFRFQQLKKDYANELKHQLQMNAQELMKRNGLTHTTGQEFNDFIKEYLHRFVQKINAY